MILKNTYLFKGIDVDVMEKIVNISSEEDYAKDTVIFKQGEKADCLYILAEGTVKLIIKNGGTLSYSLSKPGEVFGWSSMVGPGIYTASGICSTDSKVVKIEGEKLGNLFNLHPDVGLKILGRLGGVFSKRLKNAYQDLLFARGEDTTPSYG